MEDIKGIMPKVNEIMQWDAKAFNDFFLFSDFFYDEGKIKVIHGTVMTAEQYRESSPLIDELLNRIDRPYTDITWDRRKFFMRLNILFRTVKLAIQSRPTILIPILVEKQRVKIQYAWMNKLYDSKHEAVPTIVEVKKEEIPVTTEIISTNGEVLPSQRLQEAMSKVADIYDMIAGTITQKEIRALNVKDKINALNKLSYIHNTTKKFQVNPKFIKSDFKKASKEELEESLLDFGQEE